MTVCIVVLGILVLFSALDFKYRRLPVWLLSGACLGAVTYQLFWGRMDLCAVAGGIILGCLFLGLSRITGEAFGYGDSIGMVALGVFLGVWDMLEVLSYTFLGLAAGAVILLAFKKMSRKAALPFYPFLAAGYATWVWLEFQ